MVTVAHAPVHGIRGTVSNLLFRLYVGQEWLSLATLSTGRALQQEGEEVDWHYIAALRFLFCIYLSLVPLLLLVSCI